ncbi:MAG: type II toxin-antitoxin system RelE/ParE family toxin [Steroidobacteraceae bacterium]|nr:type II toxin-antitoxin system RelE/ParE family toxin [Steroidobacteraceae bacterium]
MPVDRADRPLVWLHGEIRTPPFSTAARVESGELLRRLQRRESLAYPHSRPLPIVGPACHELRITDAGANWRIVYHLRADAVVILAVFAKKTRRTPAQQIEASRDRLRRYLKDIGQR